MSASSSSNPATGLSTAQYAYRLESRTTLNAIDPSTADDFSPTQQGRSLGVSAVQKAPELDLLAALQAAGATVPEKIEGLAIGPRLADGRHLVLVGTDNDYSVTQTGSGEQFEVCVIRIDGTRAQVALDAACPAGMAGIPGILVAFAVDFDAD